MILFITRYWKHIDCQFACFTKYSAKGLLNLPPLAGASAPNDSNKSRQLLIDKFLVEEKSI